MFWNRFRARKPSKAPSATFMRPHLESLEDRTVPAVVPTVAGVPEVSGLIAATPIISSAFAPLTNQLAGEVVALENATLANAQLFATTLSNTFQSGIFGTVGLSGTVFGSTSPLSGLGGLGNLASFNQGTLSFLISQGITSPINTSLAFDINQGTVPFLFSQGIASPINMSLPLDRGQHLIMPSRYQHRRSITM